MDNNQLSKKLAKTILQKNQKSDSKSSCVKKNQEVQEAVDAIKGDAPVNEVLNEVSPEKRDNVLKMLRQMKKSHKEEVKKGGNSHFGNKPGGKQKTDSAPKKPKNNEPPTIDYSKMEPPKKEPRWKKEAKQKQEKDRQTAIQRAGGLKTPSGDKLR